MLLWFDDALTEFDLLYFVSSCIESAPLLFTVQGLQQCCYDQQMNEMEALSV